MARRIARNRPRRAVASRTIVDAMPLELGRQVPRRRPLAAAVEHRSKAGLGRRSREGSAPVPPVHAVSQCTGGQLDACLVRPARHRTADSVKSGVTAAAVRPRERLVATRRDRGSWGRQAAFARLATPPAAPQATRCGDAVPRQHGSRLRQWRPGLRGGRMVASWQYPSNDVMVQLGQSCGRS